MNGPLYISVILPLKLEWEPCYRADETVEIGNRVKVIFANKEYTGVVSGTGITPDVDPSKIRPILSVDKSTEMILPSEIENTLESPLDCKEIKAVNPKGNQS